MDIEMEWWISMPKVELHAHLNGSVRDSTLLELARELGAKGTIVFSDVEHVILKSDRSLTEVFKLFDLIHILTTDHATVTRITKEVVEDFAAENVVYLELRTTPKKNESKGMTKRSYIEAVVEGLRRVSAVDIDFSSTDIESWKTNSVCMVNSSNGIPRKKIYVRLLLSIDRRETLEAAMETVKLALEMRGIGVVGIDLSGNPRVGNWKTFLPSLVFAREQGLRVTLHCGEVPNQEEIHAMLDFHPERIGHACCLGEDTWRKLKSMKIPSFPLQSVYVNTNSQVSCLYHALSNSSVEICLTSNIRTDTISSLDVHHFADLYRLKHPLTLCTDDSGVFSTSLSNEHAIAAIAFNLGKKEMFQLSRNAVDFSFAEESVIRQLKELFDMAEEELIFQ